MSQTTTSILLASLTAAALGLSQGALAADAAAPEAAATPPAPVQAPAPTPMAAPESPDTIIARMEERHKQMIEERERRYEQLRKQASELGFEMPEMPPWAPSERAGMPSPDYAPWITTEERNALREKRWEATRERAAQHGIELPELPPWKAAEARREAMQERFEKFRTTMDELNEEQRQTIKEVIGSMPALGNMGRSWPSQSRCPHPRQPCNYPRYGYGPMSASDMMAAPATPEAPEAPAQPEAPATN
ncbi:hypothetical protein [Rhabdochromatium marinum]|uniref:hypothetical protein n=1 Tax=Rhabdochromatium marinum TaxID=48729 RepID=UPI001905B999|nr:hypothetical protein [Rhabdochromatium marinum]MBK1649990.1 hypothetical protein [Rhabdochromatium marinum]